MLETLILQFPERRELHLRNFYSHWNLNFYGDIFQLPQFARPLPSIHGFQGLVVLKVSARFQGLSTFKFPRFPNYKGFKVSLFFIFHIVARPLSTRVSRFHCHSGVNIYPKFVCSTSLLMTPFDPDGQTLKKIRGKVPNIYSRSGCSRNFHNLGVLETFFYLCLFFLLKTTFHFFAYSLQVRIWRTRHIKVWIEGFPARPSRFSTSVLCTGFRVVCFS